MNNIPVHIAIIMDGNGRWARKHGLPRSEGHRAGVRTVKTVVKAALEAAAKSGSEPFYGYDERPVDGWAIRLIVGNASIVVGSDCEDVPGCTPIPKGLAAMRDRLVAIGYAVYQSTACTEAAGGK